MTTQQLIHSAVTCCRVDALRHAKPHANECARQGAWWVLVAHIALVFFAKYAFSLNCFSATVCFVENFAAVVAKQNLQAVTINTPADVFIYRFYRVTPNMKSTQKRAQIMTTADNHLPRVLMGSSWLSSLIYVSEWRKN